jgi:5-methylcytosine-specific restriction protein A
MKMIKPLTQKHAATRKGWRPDAVRGDRHERGYGWAWEKLRKRILERDSYLCQVCRRLGQVTPASQVDHIQAKAHGGTDDLENLQGICLSCHKNKTTKESNAGGAGSIPRAVS